MKLNLNPFATFTRWDLIVMCIVMALVFTFEMLGVFNARFVTITAICRSFVPRPLRAFICLWLFWHMVIAGWLTDKSWIHFVSFGKL